MRKKLLELITKIKGRHAQWKRDDCATEIEDLLKIAQSFAWIPVVKALPVRGRPIEMTGSSGYIAPNERFVIAGYYDPEYRPLSPWLDATSTCLEDSGWKPTHWRYLTLAPTELEASPDSDGTGHKEQIPDWDKDRGDGFNSRGYAAGHGTYHDPMG